MRFCIFAIVAFLTLSFSAYGHILGKSAWCIQRGPVHYECFYESAEACQGFLKKSGDFWQKKIQEIETTQECVSFPYEFSLKPESKKPEN